MCREIILTHTNRSPLSLDYNVTFEIFDLSTKTASVILLESSECMHVQSSPLLKQKLSNMNSECKDLDHQNILRRSSNWLGGLGHGLCRLFLLSIWALAWWQSKSPGSCMSAHWARLQWPVKPYTPGATSRISPSTAQRMVTRWPQGSLYGLSASVCSSAKHVWLRGVKMCLRPSNVPAKI